LRLKTTPTAGTNKSIPENQRHLTMQRRSVTSSTLQSIGYEETSRVLEVEFKKTPSINTLVCLPENIEG
jgi:hypothetical protein